MSTLGIIPARYGSTRFPGKALADINGKSMIQRVVEQARQAQSLTDVIVATDDVRIANHVSAFGGKVVMTGSHHQSGTDRCQEVVAQLAAQGNDTYRYVINIQGDEPFIQPEQIDRLAAVLDGQTQLATLVKRISDPAMLPNPNVVKAVISSTNVPEALYFSRHPIPYQRDHAQADWLAHHAYYKHIGLYAYRTDVLAHITQLPSSSLERAELLEQLRWLENGFRIRVVETDLETVGVDTPEDLAKVTPGSSQAL